MAGHRASIARLLPIVARQAFHEGRVRLWRGIRYRSRRNDEACRAYCDLEPWEFEGLNARQAWANWRTIPRNLDGHLPKERVGAIDLCCGIGQSTEVLAFHLPQGSEILGLEYNPRFVAVARTRAYLSRNGSPATVRFRTQSVLDTFRDADGAVVPDASVDLVNSNGAVSCHFDADATRALAGEVDRVLRAGGLALIDSGRDGTSEGELETIFAGRGFRALHRTRSCLFDRYTQICFRKDV
jgi:SAM-dependent methyltransferase